LSVSSTSPFLNLAVLSESFFAEIFFFSFGALLSSPAFFRFLLNVLLYAFAYSFAVIFFSFSYYTFTSLLSFELDEDPFPFTLPFDSGFKDL